MALMPQRYIDDHPYHTLREWEKRFLGGPTYNQARRNAGNLNIFNENDPTKLDDMRDVADKLWGRVNGQRRGRVNIRKYAPYFRALEAKCEDLDPSNQVVFRYGHIIDLVELLRTGEQTMTKADHCQRVIRRRYPPQGAPNNPNANLVWVNNSVELGVRIWMMVAGGKAGFPGEPGNLEQPYVTWADDETIYDLLHKGFPNEITPDFVKDGARFPFTVPKAEIRENYFPHHFNLWDMVRLSGFKIVWTDNLFDHLFIEENNEKEFETKVYIFYNVSLLQELKERELVVEPRPFIQLYAEKPLIIRELALETLHTLGVLLPIENTLCQNWFERRREGIDTRLDKLLWWLYKHKVLSRRAFDRLHPKPPARRLDPEASEQEAPSRSRYFYHYWGYRLLKLEEQFNDPAKATFWTRLSDYRNPRDRASYLGGFCVLFFAILAFIAAIVSTVVTGVMLKEAKRANVIAYGVSTSADHAAQSSSSSASSASAAMKSSTSSPVTIVACCSASTTGNGSMVSPSPSYDMSSGLNTTSSVIITETITVVTIVTTTATDNITTTISVTPSGTS